MARPWYTYRSARRGAAPHQSRIRFSLQWQQPREVYPSPLCGMTPAHKIYVGKDQGSGGVASPRVLRKWWNSLSPGERKLAWHTWLNRMSDGLAAAVRR